MQTGRIDLGREPERGLGRLTLDPPVRSIRRDDGAQEVVEPRVMQVLLALVHAGGGIVTRDMLSESCWEGRVVGEDAINRVISRLRRVQEGIGEGSFRIETITKVGYRLIAGDGPRATAAPVAASAAAVAKPGRRGLIAGGLATLALGGAGGYAWLHRGAARTPPSEVGALMTQAALAVQQTDPEGIAAAHGLYRQVTEIAPDYADGWGNLALVEAMGFYAGEQATAQRLREAKVRPLAARALALDPANAAAKTALARMLPRIGRWAEAETMLRGALRDHPDDPALLVNMATFASGVGWMREAAAEYRRMVRASPPTPGTLYFAAVLSWASGRLDEADATIDRAMGLFPKHFGVWFTRVYILMYTGRTEEALRIVSRPEGRPTGIPAGEFDHVANAIRAIQERTPALIDAVVADALAAAHKGAGFAENGIQWAATLGRLDQAFAIADAYFFSDGFVVPDARFAPEQGGHTRLADRRTYVLFLPSTAAMRRDPRFDALVRRIGLERYWAQSRHAPDYRLQG